MVPEPGARLGRHIVRERLLENTIQIERGASGDPVYSVLVDRGDIVRGSALCVCGCASGHGGLVGVLQGGRNIWAAVGERSRVREIFDVDLLRVVFVEEDAGTGPWNIAEDRTGADAGIADVLDRGLNFSAFDRGSCLSARDPKVQEAIVEVRVRRRK